MPNYLVWQPGRDSREFYHLGIFGPSIFNNYFFIWYGLNYVRMEFLNFQIKFKLKIFIFEFFQNLYQF